MKLSEDEFQSLMSKRKAWGKKIDPKPKPKPMAKPTGKPEQQLDLNMDAPDFGLDEVTHQPDQQRIIYSIKPVPKPRQTQSDRWKKRPSVVRYHAFKDQIKAANLIVPNSGCRMIFVLPMPQSWSQKKKNQMRGMPHKQTPDTDNLVKAVLDAVLTQDSMIYHVEGLKFWGDSGQIIIEKTSKALRLDESGIIWDEVA